MPRPGVVTTNCLIKISDPGYFLAELLPLVEAPRTESDGSDENLLGHRLKATASRCGEDTKNRVGPVGYQLQACNPRQYSKTTMTEAY